MGSKTGFGGVPPPKGGFPTNLAGIRAGKNRPPPDPNCHFGPPPGGGVPPLRGGPETCPGGSKTGFGGYPPPKGGSATNLAAYLTGKIHPPPEANCHFWGGYPPPGGGGPDLGGSQMRGGPNLEGVRCHRTPASCVPVLCQLVHWKCQEELTLQFDCVSQHT